MAKKESKISRNPLVWWNVLVTLAFLALLWYHSIPVAWALYEDVLYGRGLSIVADWGGSAISVRDQYNQTVLWASDEGSLQLKDTDGHENLWASSSGDLRVGSSSALQGSVRVYGTRTDALRVARSDSTDVFRVNTSTPQVKVVGSADPAFIVDGNGSAPYVFEVDTTNGYVDVHSWLRAGGGVETSEIHAKAGEDLVFRIGP